MDKILITGFERFGDYKENITEALSRKVSTLSNYSLEYLIFPVRIFSDGAKDYGKEIVSRAQEIGAKAIISLGMSSNVRGVRVELCALNWVENEKYCLDTEQRRVLDEKLIIKKPLFVELKKWNLNNIFNSLREKKLVHEPCISIDAGFFCCNALMFRTLQAIERTQCSIPYIFLHVSRSPGAVEGLNNFNRNKHLMTVEELKEVLEVFVENI